MGTDVNVRPTPIQRNILDVATELTKLHFDRCSMEDEDHIKKVFAEYYALVIGLEVTKRKSVSKLTEFLPEDIKNKLV